MVCGFLPLRLASAPAVLQQSVQQSGCRLMPPSAGRPFPRRPSRPWASRQGATAGTRVLAECLAQESGLHPRYISDVERGRRNVGMVNVDRLARALAVDLPTLMAGVEAQRSR